eukprot:TRINITY_DN16109_c0_g7_i1.p1 TRINITY_DN16109_c0_g7~~TRINITY_DN16109_c0_g7_i1.p1  ORF type:complete len:411 (+),score=172.46 TRINITY_DN16109_c0_g7_i1:56-1234(+)
MARSDDRGMPPIMWQLCADYLQPVDLYGMMRVCRKLKMVAQNGVVWKKFVERMLDSVDESSEWVDYFGVAKELVLLKGKEKDVLSAALGASSTDASNQTVHETTNAKLTTFWSSTGSESEHSEDSVCYLLSGHLALIDHIKLTFYQADYQEEAPIYYCRGVQILVGHPAEGSMSAMTKLGLGTYTAGFGPSTRHGSEKDTLELINNADFHYTSQVFDVTREETQVFKLNKLVAGSIVKIVMTGKTTRQKIDDLYYVCLQRMRIQGFTGCDLSETTRRLLLSKHVRSEGYCKLLKLLASEDVPTKGITELATDDVAAKYLMLNAPVDYKQRGVDSTVELLNRQLNLMTDLAVKKYGPSFTNPHDDEQEYCKDMLALKEIYERFKQSTMQEHGS